MIKGNDIILMIGGSAVASAKSCDIDYQCDLIEVSSGSSGTERYFLPQRTKWTINCSKLLTSFKEPLTMAGSYVLVKMGSVISGTRNISSDSLQGYAYVTHVKVTATRGNLAQCSITLQGNGGLTPVTRQQWQGSSQNVIVAHLQTFATEYAQFVTERIIERVEED